MIKKSPLAVAAFVMMLGSASLSLIPSVGYADQTSEKAKVEVFRQEWSKPYQEIQKLIGNKQYAEAMEKVNVLAAADKQTPYEMFFISRTRAVLASSTGDNSLLAKCFEEMINSDFLSPAEKLKYTEGMASTYYQEKKYPDSQKWVRRYLALDTSNKVMQDLFLRNFFATDDFASVVREGKLLIEEDAKSDRIPGEDRLRIVFFAFMKLKDIEGSTPTLEMMVKHYPKREYWADLLYRIPNRAGFSDRLTLDWYRIMFATGNLEDAEQYFGMAEAAMLAGLPLEAKNAMDAGYKSGILGKGVNAAKQKPMHEKAIKSAAEDDKQLDAGEATARSAKTGVGLVNMGYNYALHGQFEKGIAMMEQGIAKGGLKAPEEAKLHLGLAYHMSGNKEKAIDVFATVRGTDGAATLARYWSLFVTQ